MKINISFITSDYFCRLCPFVFLMSTSKHKYRCFLSLVQSFSACTFSLKNLCVDCFQYKPFHQFGHTFPFKWPRQEAKTKQQQNKRHSRQQQQQAKSVRRRTAISQRKFFGRVVTGTLRWLARLHYLLYFLAFDWLRSAVLFFLNWTVCLFVKESPIWNYSNKSLIRQFVKIKLKDSSVADNIGLTKSYN